jgi:signal transduction histidine kinase
MTGPEDILGRCGATGALVRSTDWSGTPLGAREAWPARVTAAVEIALAGGLPLGVVLGRRPSTAIVIYNDPFIAFLGQKHPAAMGRPAREVWPEIWDFFEWALGQVWRTGRPVTGKDVLLRVERGEQPEEIHATLSFSAIHDEGGAVCGALVCAIETTAAVLSARREHALRVIAEDLSEARTEDELQRALGSTLLTASRDVPFALLYLLDAEGKTASLRASVGLEAGAPGCLQDIDLQGEGGDQCALCRVVRSRRKVVVASDAVPLSAMVALAGAPRATAVVPVMGGSQNDPIGVLVVGLNPSLAFDDAYDGFVRLVAHEIARALSNLRSREEARRRVEMQATLDREAAESKLKDVFMGLASHELRSPLSCFKLDVELIHHEIEARDVQFAKKFARLQRSIDWMARLVDDLLSYSSLSSGKLQLLPERCDLREICRTAAEAQEAVTRRAATLTVPDAEVVVVADADRVGQVVANLLSNAFKYSTADRPVTLTLTTAEREANVTVRDQGAGIPPEALDHVFEQFYRTPGVGVRSGSYVGLGLGLFLARAIVEQHGGRVRVESVVGQGSAFSFTLPLAS